MSQTKDFYRFKGHLIDLEKVSYISPLYPSSVENSYNGYYCTIIIDSAIQSIHLCYPKRVSHATAEQTLRRFKLKVEAANAN